MTSTQAQFGTLYDHVWTPWRIARKDRVYMDPVCIREDEAEWRRPAMWNEWAGRDEAAWHKSYAECKRIGLTPVRNGRRSVR